MNPIRREIINGLLVLVVASLLSAAFAAFSGQFRFASLGADPDGNRHRGRRLSGA
jgi:hypothetical protein